jgi:hypothetical protein
MENHSEKDSIGEEFIEEFFRHEEIKYERQSKISDLKNDTSQYRVADFYLPRLKVYVEFLGQWQMDEYRRGYNEKKKIYTANRKPCVYLYPDNLGVLKFVFERRLKQVLREHKLNNELRRFQFKQLWEKSGEAFVLAIISLLFLAFGNYEKNVETNRIYIIIFSSVLVYQFYRIVRAVIKVYAK